MMRCQPAYIARLLGTDICNCCRVYTIPMDFYECAVQAGRQQRKMIAMEYKVMENKAFDIKSMTLPEVRQVVEAMGEKPFAQNSSMSGCM